MNNLLQKYGPVALVTGASSGIGEQFARLLAKQGFDLLITARRLEKLEQLADELSSTYRVQVDFLVADLSKQENVDELIKRAKERDLGLIVSNAGFGAKGEFFEHDYVQVEAMYQANSFAPSKLAYCLLPQLVTKGRGGIIFTGSVEGEVPFPFSAPYAASKAFLHSLASSLWFEMKPYNVHVLLLAPGSTDTEAPYKQGMTREQLIGLLPPETVAEQALQNLGRKMTLTPGVINCSFISFFKLLPRRWATVLAGMSMKKAIADAQKARATS